MEAEVGVERVADLGKALGCGRGTNAGLEHGTDVEANKLWKGNKGCEEIS